MANKIAFVAWVLTTRSKVLAQHLNADIISYRKHFSNPILRLIHYKFLSILTIIKLSRKKYDTIFVQIPPIQAALTAFFYTKITGTKLIFDTHSGIFFPKGLHQRLYFSLYCSMTRHIKLNIVHNESILKRLSFKNTPIVLLEPFQAISHSYPQRERTDLNITMICGYGKDEPIQEMLSAAALLPNYKFYLTGDFTKSKIDKNQIPQNVIPTGYLSDQEYEGFLRKMDIIIVLTTRPDTVLCGAYEAIGLGIPLITSDTFALRKHFYKGTIFTSNDSESIAEAINTATQNLDKLSKEISELRKEKEENWEKQFAIVQQHLK